MAEAWFIVPNVEQTDEAWPGDSRPHPKYADEGSAWTGIRCGTNWCVKINASQSILDRIAGNSDSTHVPEQAGYAKLRNETGFDWPDEVWKEEFKATIG